MRTNGGINPDTSSARNKIANSSTLDDEARVIIGIGVWKRISMTPQCVKEIYSITSGSEAHQRAIRRCRPWPGIGVSRMAHNPQACVRPSRIVALAALEEMLCNAHQRIIAHSLAYKSTYIGSNSKALGSLFAKNQCRSPKINEMWRHQRQQRPSESAALAEPT